MVFIYNLIFALFALIYFPYILIKGKWHSGFWTRLGFFPNELRNILESLSASRNLWFHAVSVGEILAIVGLIEKVRVQFPDYKIILSTVTKTGYALAKSKFSYNDIIIYAPLDFSWIVRKFIRRLNPSLYITAETEIWPNLFSALAQKRIPIIQVNGRISDQSYARYKKVSWLLRPVLNAVDALCMQSPLDAQRIIALGALPERVHVVGNIKFDELPNTAGYKASTLDLAEGTPVWIAGSTHPGEEKIVLEVFQKLRPEFPDLKLVIAPRHVERTPEIMALIKSFDFYPLKFSDLMQREKFHPQLPTIVIVDTIGHLRSLYNLATVVFIGKSLTGHGGQNIIEPAFFGKAILVGPHMENFKSVMSALLENQAIIQVNHAEALRMNIRELLKDEEKRAKLGRQAKSTVEKYQGATEKTQKIIADLLNKIYLSK